MGEFLILSFFGLFSASIIIAGAYVFFAKNILYALYALMAVLVSISGIYILAGADFIAVSHLMIYVGGILILLLFGIMMGGTKKVRNDILRIENVNALWSVIVAFVVFSALLWLIKGSVFAGDFQPELNQNTVKLIGLNLMTRNLLILESLGILLLLALIGSTYLASKHD